MGWEGGGLHLLRPGSRQPLALLEKEFCPSVYEETELSYIASSTEIVSSTSKRPPTETLGTV